MAGYSGTPLPRKLGIRAGHCLALIQAPPRFEQVLGELPDDVVLRKDLRGKQGFDVAVLFAARMNILTRRFEPIAKRLHSAGGLWVAWPKKASGVPTDVTEAQVRTFGLEQGLVDNKICAIDETWSGLRFVYRLKDRPGRR